MQLRALQDIAKGITTLAELEAKEPLLGRELGDFVRRIEHCCEVAYGRLSVCADEVLSLPRNADEKDRAVVLKHLRAVGDSEWFRNVAGICDDLAALSNTYDTTIRRHLRAIGPSSNMPSAAQERGEDGQDVSILNLLSVLHRHEGNLKDDIRDAAGWLLLRTADGDIDEAKQGALRIKAEISEGKTCIRDVAMKIIGTGAQGALDVITNQQVAAQALRQPERVLLFNMAIVVILLIVGATALQFVTPLAFVALTAFILAAVVVMNAFHLRSIDKLSDESFVELIKLALLQFFAPLVSPRRGR